MAKNAEKITTLLLDAAFLPHCFLTGKTAFLHLLKNSIKCFDSQSNLIENNNEWFKNEGIYFYDDQPFLTSKDKIWLLPTIAVLKKKTFFDFKTKYPNKMSLKKLAIIFNNTCQICFERYDKKDLTIEHIYPKPQNPKTPKPRIDPSQIIIYKYAEKPHVVQPGQEPRLAGRRTSVD